jgi:glycosyltransferase involved in cell wall biosynthesis
LVVTGIFPPDIGGPATYVPMIAKYLDSRGHLITVATLSSSLEHNDMKYGFRVVRMRRHLFKPWRWLRTLLILIRLGRNSDVLFVNGLAMETTLANIILRKPLVLKVVGDFAWERATNWGWVKDDFEVFQKERYGLRVKLLKVLRSRWTRRADKVIVPSRYLGKWVGDWGVSTEKLTVIYNAIQSANDIKPVEVPLTTAVNIVTVGRLVPWKQIDKVIDNVAQFEDVGLVIVGDGPERPYLEEITLRRGLKDRVYFAGQKTHEDTMALIAACELFVLNSTYEGLPHVLLEAMSQGLPVVATAVGGTTEVVEDGFNGLLLSPQNSRTLGEMLLRILFSPVELNRLADGARQTAKHFHLARMVQETEAVLQEAARVETLDK